MHARAFLPAIGLALLATLQGSGQVVINMPAPKGPGVPTGSAPENQPVNLGTVALNRYSAARAAPLYGYVSPTLAWPLNGYGRGYGFGFPYFGFGFGFGYGFRYGYPRCFGGFWGSAILIAP